MQVIEIKSKLNIDDILGGVAQLETQDIEDFLQKVSLILAQRKAPSLSNTETGLLKIINESVSVTTRNRYRALRKEFENETITPAHYQELLELTAVIEQGDVERLKGLIALSQLRGVDLKTLMKQLDIYPNPVDDFKLEANKISLG